MIILYHGTTSPFSWRVQLALEHKKLAYELKITSASKGETRTSEFLKLNPRHKLPAIDDDGFALYESLAILDYLEDKYPSFKEEENLWPRDVRQRAIARRLALEADLYFVPAMTNFLRQILWTEESLRIVSEIVKYRNECIDELKYFESALSGDFFVGEISAVDFVLYPLFALTLHSEKPDKKIVKTVGPRLRSWKKRIESLPYFSKTWPAKWKELPLD